MMKTNYAFLGVSLLAAILPCGIASAQTTTSTYEMAAATTAPKPVDLFGDGKVRVIVRLDDAGFCHAADMGIEKVLNEGVVSAVSVMVVTPWLDEAVDMLKKHPEVSIGVHTCLNSEWTPYRWGPVLPPGEVPTLVDEWGKFYGTRKRMMERNPNLDEVEKELRAQVELARRKGLKLSYLDHHMSGAVTTVEMRARFERVARDYGLAVSRWFQETQGPIIYSVEPAKKPDFLVEEMRKIRTPGTYLIVAHVGINTPELAALKDLNPTGPVNMAEHREGEMNALCDPRLKQVMREKQFELIGYDVLRARFLDRMAVPE
jgi:chitin disaccharide deacetylase